MSKCIIIDTANKQIYEAPFTEPHLDCMQKAVGGYIERAHIIDDLNECYVNEEGLFNESTDFFSIAGAHQPFAGNGVIVGYDDHTGESSGTTLTIEQIKQMVVFIPRSQITGAD